MGRDFSLLRTVVHSNNALSDVEGISSCLEVDEWMQHMSVSTPHQNGHMGMNISQHHRQKIYTSQDCTIGGDSYKCWICSLFK